MLLTVECKWQKKLRTSYRRILIIWVLSVFGRLISKPLINIHVFSPLSYSAIRSSIATEIAFFHAGIQVCSNLHEILSILSISSTKVNINFSSLRTSSSEYKTFYFEILCIFMFANSQYVKK